MHTLPVPNGGNRNKDSCRPTKLASCELLTERNCRSVNRGSSTEDVARLLTRLVTREAALPQGAPMSSALANLALSLSVDARIHTC